MDKEQKAAINLAKDLFDLTKKRVTDIELAIVHTHTRPTLDLVRLRTLEVTLLSARRRVTQAENVLLDRLENV